MIVNKRKALYVILPILLMLLVFLFNNNKLETFEKSPIITLFDKEIKSPSTEPPSPLIQLFKK